MSFYNFSAPIHWPLLPFSSYTSFNMMGHWNTVLHFNVYVTLMKKAIWYINKDENLIEKHDGLSGCLYSRENFSFFQFTSMNHIPFFLKYEMFLKMTHTLAWAPSSVLPFETNYYFELIKILFGKEKNQILIQSKIVLIQHWQVRI